MKIIMFNKVGSRNVSPTNCLCHTFSMLKIKFIRKCEEGNKNGEKDEEKRVTTCFGNNKN